MEPLPFPFDLRTGHAPDCPGRCKFYSWEVGTVCARYGPSIHRHRAYWIDLYQQLRRRGWKPRPGFTVRIERSCTAPKPSGLDPLPTP